MKKKNYYTPETKFHQLRGNAVMQAATTEMPYDPEPDEPAGAKGGSLYFDEDE